MISHATAPQTKATLFLRRILALALRHIYLYLGSWPRLVETMYWPLINVLMMGFVAVYIGHGTSNGAASPAVFFAGALLCEVMVRGSHGMLIMFIEEMWSRNLGHLFAGPLKFSTYRLGLMALSATRIILSVIPATLVVKYLFGFSLLSLGTPLLIYIPLLICNGWIMGLIIISLLLRMGLAAEWVGWMLIWLILPLAAPYYPTAVLPMGLRVISEALPATYVFQSMQSLINQHELHADYLWKALALNITYLTLASFLCQRGYRAAQIKGGLLQTGE